MEMKKNAEPVTLFSNDTIDIIDSGAAYFTEDALNYGLDGTDFPRGIEDVQREIIQKLDLEGRAVPDAEGSLLLVEELTPEEFFSKLTDLVPDAHKIAEAVHDAIWDALYQDEAYLNNELEERHEQFAIDLSEAGLLKKESEPYLIMVNGAVNSHNIPPYDLPSITNTKDIVCALEGNDDCTTRIEYTRGKPYLKATVFSHDAPMGQSISIIPQSWFQKAFEDKELAKDIQSIMDYDDDVANAVYEAMPELYKGKEGARALRDYVVTRLMTPSIAPVPDEKLEAFAKDVLSFQSEGLKSVCEQDPYHHPKDSFEAYQEDVWEYMGRIEDGEAEHHPYRQKDVAALTRLFQSRDQCSLSKIGDVVEAIAQDKGRMKALNRLIESQQEADRAKQATR